MSTLTRFVVFMGLDAYGDRLDRYYVPVEVVAANYTEEELGWWSFPAGDGDFNGIVQRLEKDAVIKEVGLAFSRNASLVPPPGGIIEKVIMSLYE